MCLECVCVCVCVCVWWEERGRQRREVKNEWVKGSRGRTGRFLTVRISKIKRD